MVLWPGSIMLCVWQPYFPCLGSKVGLTPAVPPCSSSKDPGRVGGGRRSGRIHRRVPGPGLAAAGRPVARPGRPAGGLLTGAAGSGLAGPVPNRQPAEGRPAGSALHLQRLQPAGPGAGRPVRPAAPPTAAGRATTGAAAAAGGGSGQQAGSVGGRRGVDGAGRGSAGRRLLEEVTSHFPIRPLADLI